MVSSALLIASFLILLLVIAKFVGNYIALLIESDLAIWVFKIESGLWSCCQLRKPGGEIHEMNWRQYVTALLLFNVIGGVFLFLLLINQYNLLLNPQKFVNLNWDLALNTAMSFITNTNWQAYSGEHTLSYFSQMTGLTVQNFLSAATGIAVFCADPRLCPPRGKNAGQCLDRYCSYYTLSFTTTSDYFCLIFCHPRCVTKFFAVSSGRNITKPKPNYPNGTRRFAATV